jgi:hypothetical protein
MQYCASTIFASACAGVCVEVATGEASAPTSAIATVHSIAALFMVSPWR